MDSLDRRRGARVKTRFESLYSTGPAEGTGMLADISYSGAQIVGASLKPEVDKPLRIYVFVQPVAPFELSGEVVRHSQDQGFAIEFKELSSELRALVDDAAAIVSAVG